MELGGQRASSRLNFAGRNPRLLVPALFLLILAGYEFATFQTSASLQSTFNLPSGDYYQISTTRNPSDTISGQFHETSGRPVSFFIFTSAQFAAFQVGTSLDSVYNITDSASSAISYTFKNQDTFYLVFRHGSGLLNTTETVYFQRTYTASDSLRATLAFVFLIFGALNLVLAFIKRKPKAVAPPPQPNETTSQ